MPHDRTAEQQGAGRDWNCQPQPDAQGGGEHPIEAAANEMICLRPIDVAAGEDDRRVGRPIDRRAGDDFDQRLREQIEAAEGRPPQPGHQQQEERIAEPGQSAEQVVERPPRDRAVIAVV